MKTLIYDDIARIMKSKKQLEENLNIKITSKEKKLSIEGSPEDEYLAEKVVDAVYFGFPFSTAMSIKNEDFSFEIVNIKDHTKRYDLERVRGRIIGKSGKTLKTLSNLTECSFEIKDNCVGIIGEPEHMKNAIDAIIFIIKGSKQANVYAYLEKHRVGEILDLGLKKPKK